MNSRSFVRTDHERKVFGLYLKCPPPSSRRHQCATWALQIQPKDITLLIRVGPRPFGLSSVIRPESPNAPPSQHRLGCCRLGCLLSSQRRVGGDPPGIPGSVSQMLDSRLGDYASISLLRTISRNPRCPCGLRVRSSTARIRIMPGTLFIPTCPAE